MKRFTFLIFIFILTISVPAPAQPCLTPTNTLKLATLIPEGTKPFNSLNQIKQELLQKTKGCVELKIYSGGVMGNDPDVIRKMHVNQIQAATFSGMGLGLILPEVRVLELPALFQNTQQIDYVYKAEKKYFYQRFLEKGFVLLAWAEIGFVQTFCTHQPLITGEDAKKLKLWMPDGDPLAQAMYEAMNLVPIPLNVTDVLMSLQTGIIDCASAPPIAAIAMQWHTKAKYITKYNLINVTGGLLITKKSWDLLKPSYQALLQEVINSEIQKMVTQARSENSQALHTLQSLGLTLVEPDSSSVSDLNKVSLAVQNKLVGKLYSRELLDRILKRIRSLR